MSNQVFSYRQTIGVKKNPHTRKKYTRKPLLDMLINYFHNIHYQSVEPVKVEIELYWHDILNIMA